MRLTSIDADLQVSVQSWLGSGMIKVKQREHRSLLTEIVAEMNRYFSVSSAPIKLTTCVFYVVMGVLMVIGGIGTGVFIPKNPHDNMRSIKSIKVKKSITITADQGITDDF